MTKAEARKKWETRVTAFKASGQTAPKWCLAHDLKLHQLRYWLRKYESKKAAVTPSSKWMPIEVAEQSNDPKSSLLIRIGQADVEVKLGFNPVLLSDVVRTLAGLC